MHWRRFQHIAAAASIACAVVATADARQGTDPLTELNQSVLVPGTRDAAEVLFPAVANMSKPPARPTTLRQVSLLTSKSREWPEWEAWAKAEPQQEALAALKTITDPKSRYLVGLRFGRSEAKPEWVSAGLYVDIGDPPLIALAPSGMHYLDRLDLLMMLCTAEAERLATEKKPSECAAVLINWLRFARMIADRPFAIEKGWAIAQANAALERLGDIACSHPGLFDEKTVQETNRELDPRALASERIRFPIGERLALRQLVLLTIEERGGPKPDAFGPTMGRLTMDRNNPFDLFPHSAHWDEIGRQHAGWFDVREQIDKVLNDWQKRWDLNNIFDPLMQTPTDYSRMDRLKFAMIAQVVDGMQDLFSYRTQVVTTLGGTRSALAVVGFRAAQGQWPPNLVAVQPRFVQTLDNDPWYFERERQVRANYRFFVPMRDQPLGPRELPKPHRMVVNLDSSVDAAIAPEAGGPVAELLDRFQLNTLASIAKDVVDSGGGVDSATLRERWLPLAKEEGRRGMREMEARLQAMPTAEREALMANQKMQWTMTPAQLGETMRTLLSVPAVRDSLAQSSARLGLSVDEAAEFIEKASVVSLSSASNREVLEQLMNGQKPSDELVDKATEELIASLTQGDLLNNYVRKVLVHFAAAGGAGAAGNSITVELTDSDFVIYSVGPDMKADFAKNVGRAGPDILIWPPPLTLERRVLSGN